MRPRSLRRRLRAIRFRLEVLGARALYWLVPKVPRESLIGLAQLVGELGYWLLRSERRVALANLDAAYGDALSPRDKRRIARQSFQHFAQVGLELFWFERFDRREIERIVTVDDVSRRRGGEHPQGAFVLASHAGNWEVLNVHAGLLGLKISTLARRLRNDPLNDLVNRGRTSSGNNEVIYHDEAARGILRARRAGRYVAIALDQNTRPDRGGIYVPFFGLEVAASRALAMFALRSDDPVILACCRRLRGGRYRVIWKPPIEMPKDGDRAARERELTRRCMAAIEAEIREDPGSWLWQYRRFKYRPTPEQGRYPFYSKYVPESEAGGAAPTSP